MVAGTQLAKNKQTKKNKPVVASLGMEL